MSKNYAIIIQFVLPLTPFYRSGARRRDVYKRDAFVTTWRFHNRAWQPERRDRLPETSGKLWIHRGALTNQRCSLATGCGIKRKRSWLISITKTKLGSLSSIDVYMLMLGSLCIYEYHTDIDEIITKLLCCYVVMVCGHILYFHDSNSVLFFYRVLSATLLLHRRRLNTFYQAESQLYLFINYSFKGINNRGHQKSEIIRSPNAMGLLPDT